MKIHQTRGRFARIWAVLLVACFSLAAQASEPETTEQVMTMRIKGQVGFDTQGRVIARQFDTPMTPSLTAFVDKAVSGWRAKPLGQDGQSGTFKSPLQITLVGREATAG